jgi:hypothetical protein
MKMHVHHPHFLQVINSIKPILRAYPPLAVMHFDDLCDWMSFYWNRGTMTWVIDDFGEGHGVCLIKLFRDLSQFMDHNVHEPCGRFCMIELLASDNPITTGILFKSLTDRWGPQETIMWDRGKRTANGAPRMYRWDQFTKIARRVSYGITENA